MMANPIRITQLARRDLLIGGSSAAVLTAWLSLARAHSQNLPSNVTSPGSNAAPANSTESWQQAYRKVVGDAKPIEGRINFELPALAENGNTVPYSVTIDSPMTDQDHIKAIHVFATTNPLPSIATFRLTPQSGLAIVAGRMRLAASQDVVALAELSNGQFLISRRSITVAIGGCGG